MILKVFQLKLNNHWVNTRQLKRESKMSNTEDQNQLNEEQQPVEMSFQEWVQVIEENIEELYSQFLKLKPGMDVDVDVDTEMQINPVVEYLMKIAVEELEEWKATRKEHPDWTPDFHVAFYLHGERMNFIAEEIDCPDLMMKYLVLMSVAALIKNSIDIIYFDMWYVCQYV